MPVLFFQNQLRARNFPHNRGVAFYNDTTFFASGVDEGGSELTQSHPAPTLDSLRDWVKNRFGDSQPQESEYQPGTVYKRIHRPLASTGSLARALDRNKVTQSLVALRILLNRMEEVFETVEPTTNNLSVYGHKIRELLLLACMEVESSCAAVLKENQYPSTNRLTTNDYVKLRVPMLLDSYEMSLRSYPEFPSFVPFETWDTSAPTQTLGWYDAYNKTKHDRESNLHLASLQMAIHAVGAAAVMFHAQFGFHLGPSPLNEDGQTISTVFSTTPHQRSKYPNACYIPAMTPNKNAVPQPSFDWKLVDFPF